MSYIQHDVAALASKGTLYCSNATAHLYADFLVALVDGMHAHNKRVAVCIEMGCLLGEEYWELYASTGGWQLCLPLLSLPLPLSLAVTLPLPPSLSCDSREDIHVGCFGFFTHALDDKPPRRRLLSFLT